MSPFSTDRRSARVSMSRRTEVRSSRSAREIVTTWNPCCGWESTSPCSASRVSASRATPRLTPCCCASTCGLSRSPGCSRPLRMSAAHRGVHGQDTGLRERGHGGDASHRTAPSQTPSQATATTAPRWARSRRSNGVQVSGGAGVVHVEVGADDDRVGASSSNQAV